MFKLLDQDENLVGLPDFQGSPLLIFFYPKADTPGCTKQSCSVRDALPDFKEMGIKAVGISPDKPKSQAKFDAKFDLGFPLLSDPDHAIAEAYGAWGEKSMYGRKYMGIIRSAFLVSDQALIEQAWYKVKPADMVPAMLEAMGETSRKKWESG